MREKGIRPKFLGNKEFIGKIPKSDVHVHLDGSIRLNTLIELARKQSVHLPSYSVEGLQELVFKDRYQNLGEYLEGFKYTVPVLQDRESLERVAYELAMDNIKENVLWLEVRFAPQLHLHPKLDMEAIISSICKGIERAAKEYNVTIKKDEPEFRYGIVVCAMRMFTKSFSHYFKQFSRLLHYTDFKQQTGLASLELSRAAVHIRETKGLPIVAFDLAGQEDGYPAIDHKRAYHYVLRNFMNKTVHAGEAYGPESIFQAITELHADRLGHAYHLFSDHLIMSSRIKDKKAYVQALTEYIADKRITIEVCLTSNLQTLPVLHELHEHSFSKMLDHCLSVTICTDNRTVSNTSVSKELHYAINEFDLSSKELKDLIVNGFKRSFFPGTYSEKRRYVRKIINKFKSVEKHFQEKEKQEH